MQGPLHIVRPDDVREAYDAIVVGAGPAGCATAACLAARGASVLLVESNPRAAARFAGEWIHPEGRRVLDDAGLLEGLDTHLETAGFLVCPNDGLAPIRLGYPGGARGFACEHETLVTHLRSRVARLPRVDYVEGVRAQTLGATQVSLRNRRHEVARIETSLVAVAAGRSAGGDDLEASKGSAKVSISSMAGLLVEDASLPAEGFGHVILGGPGPALAYRIDPKRIRICINVPHGVRRGTHASEWIWKSFSEVLPESLREGVRASLGRAELSWAANTFRPRRYRTRSGVALVGDAAGVFHPLTALGITMAALDAEALAKSESLARYGVQRSKESYVPELLSNAIYQAFARNDVGAEAIRESILRSWRGSPSHCERTMSLLGATSTRRADFMRAFSRVALRAGVDALLHEPHALRELKSWLRWPWATVHPRPALIRSRSLAWASPDTWDRPNFFDSPESMEERRHAQ